MDDHKGFVRLKYTEDLYSSLDRIIPGRLGEIGNTEGEHYWQRVFTLTKSREFMYRYDTDDDRCNIFSLENLNSSDLENHLDTIIKQLKNTYKNYNFKVLEQQYNITSYDLMAIVKVEEYVGVISRYKTSMDTYPTTDSNPVKGETSAFCCCAIL